MIKDKRIIVTGGSGFLGSHIVDRIKQNNEIFVPRSREYDLKTEEGTKQIFADFPNADIVIHAAADIGGIGYSSTHPADQFYNNTLINLNVVHQAHLAGINKFVGVGSVCEYPADTPVPFKEENLWNGYPVVTNDSYGLTKRMLLVQCDAYRKQYGMNSIHLLPVNLYGPRDNFDSMSSHVIPALIKKIIRAKENNSDSVEVWGTGDESREFVYVDDVAEAVLKATEFYDKCNPVNIGSGKEITIKDLANLIKDILDYKGDFKYLHNGLGGQKRRMLDVSRAKEEFGFEAKTDFRVGLTNTIKYYLDNREKLDA